MGFDSISLVTSGITLVAFIFVVVLYGIRFYLKNVTDQIKSASEKDRAILIANLPIQIEAENLTKAQQYELAVKQLENRQEFIRIIAVLATIFMAVMLILTVFAISSNRPEMLQMPTSTSTTSISSNASNPSLVISSTEVFSTSTTFATEPQGATVTFAVSPSTTLHSKIITLTRSQEGTYFWIDYQSSGTSDPIDLSPLTFEFPDNREPLMLSDITDLRLAVQSVTASTCFELFTLANQNISSACSSDSEKIPYQWNDPFWQGSFRVIYEGVSIDCVANNQCELRLP